MCIVSITLIYGNKMYEAWICQHWKDEHIWFNHLRIDFMNLLDYYVFVTTSLWMCFMKLFGNILKLWALYVLPCAVTSVITQLDAKVCVILVSWRPICVTVIEFLLCDGDNESRMCDDNIEFRLCDGVWVPSLWWPVTWSWFWFSLFWINDLIKSHSIYYVISWWNIFRSFVLYYFHSWIAWCCIVLIILVKFWMKLIMNNSIGISLIIACFIKCSVSWNLHFPDLHIIFATYWALAHSNYLSRLANWLVIPRV